MKVEEEVGFHIADQRMGSEDELSPAPAHGDGIEGAGIAEGLRGDDQGAEHSD